MDVTNEIRLFNIIYGSSDNTAPGGLSSSKSLNYAKGATITKPQHESVISAPFYAGYVDEVGLFGAENYFIKFKVDLQYSNILDEQEESSVPVNDYYPARTQGAPYTAQTNPGCPLTEEPQPHPVGTCDPPREGVYDDLGWWPDLDIPENVPVNDYYPAKVSNVLEKAWDSMCLIDLQNLGTGNQYNDVWLDVSLYTKHRELHQFDRMWIQYDDFFYLGVHARNTRRLPYNIMCIIGKELGRYSLFTEEQKQQTAIGSQPG